MTFKGARLPPGRRRAPPSSRRPTPAPAWASWATCSRRPSRGTRRRRRDSRSRPPTTRRRSPPRSPPPATRPPGVRVARTARQMAYNFVFYGPAQHLGTPRWRRSFPTAAGALGPRTSPPFVWKVFLNQAVLGPVVVATFFGWSMTLTGRADEYPAKIWKRRVSRVETGLGVLGPRRIRQLRAVPLKAQVLYMSCCSIVWNYIPRHRGRGGSQEKPRGRRSEGLHHRGRVSCYFPS